MERTPPHEVIDLLVLARRLDGVQSQPPAPLPRHWARDGPGEQASGSFSMIQRLSVPNNDYELSS